jgi:hypothetical protein
MSRRDRKFKGTLSILDEFTSESGAGELVYTPSAPAEVLKRIEEATRLADAPSSIRKAKVESNDLIKIIDLESNLDSNIAFSQKHEHKAEPEALAGNKISGETRNKELIKPKQSTNKPVMDFEEKPVTEMKTRNKELTGKHETRNVDVIKPKQSTNKPVMDFGDLSFDKVSTFQRKILQVIFQEIQANPFEKETRPLNIQQLGSLLGVVDIKGFESLRIVVLRLEKSGFLIKTKIKTGRSGWTQYSLPNQAFDQLLKISQIEKPVIKDEQSTNKPVTKPVIDSSSKIVSNINNLSNYLEPQNQDWFKELDFSAVSPVGPMQVNSSIRAMVKESLTPETTQEFINRFKSWMATQSKVNNPLGLFCDKLKELAKEGDSPVLAFMTEEERKIQTEFSLQVEKAKIELELIQKVKDHDQKSKLEKEFESWYASASDEELLEEQKPNTFLDFKGEMYKKAIKGLFFQKRGIQL